LAALIFLFDCDFVFILFYACAVSGGAIGFPLMAGMAALSYAWLEALFLRLNERFGERTPGIPHAAFPVRGE
jgi:hypothetical protein